MTDRELINLARAAMANSYSPYSRFPVGAAIECADGSVYTGCNIENAAFGATMCAEAVALSSAVAEGKRDFVRIAIISDGVNYTLPCGACRQMLTEFSPEMEIIAVRADGRYVSYKLDKLLPSPFTYRT
jgi:cytidine deaminase